MDGEGIGVILSDEQNWRVSSILASVGAELRATSVCADLTRIGTFISSNILHVIVNPDTDEEYEVTAILSEANGEVIINGE